MESESDQAGVRPGRLLYLLAFSVAAFWILHRFVFEAIRVASASMEPTLPVGTHAWADKLTPRFSEIRRGEIVLVRSPEPPHEEVVKRVIAVAGDRIELKEKKVVLNGEELSEPYAVHKRAGERLSGDTLSELVVPKDSLFVLGDNRDESNDSSVWKSADGSPHPFVKLEDVRGRVRGFFKK